MEKVPEVYLPVMWFGVSADLSDKLLSMIHFTMIGPWIGSFCFFLMFVTCMVVVARSAIKYSKMKNEISNNEQVRTEEGTQDNKDISSQSFTREKDAARDVIDSERN